MCQPYLEVAQTVHITIPSQQQESHQNSGKHPRSRQVQWGHEQLEDESTKNGG
jgi:hypothetical protein